MLSFDRILVTPFADLKVGKANRSIRGGAHWPEFERQTLARHCRGGVPIDEPPPLAVEQEALDGRFAWGGPVFPHFGHQIADFGMRLAPTLAAWPDAIFLYAARASDPLSSLDGTPEYFRSMLTWLGIPPDRVRLLDRPTRVSELVVAPQAEQIDGPGPSGAHLDWLDDLTARRLGTPAHAGVVYVSRAGMPRRFAAEKYLEQALSRCGVRVIRPETLPLQEQLRTYATADHLVFAEGSAVYGAQLLGRALARVTVLQRKKTRYRKAHTSLGPRSQSLEYLDLLRGHIHGIDGHGTPRYWDGISVLDDTALVEAFEARGIPIGSHWRAADFAAQRDADVREWLNRQEVLGIPGASDYIRDTLRAAGLEHLA